MKIVTASINKTVLILLMILVSQGVVQASQDQPREMRFKNVIKEVKDPPASFRSAPLWVWNTDVTKEDIDRMLNEFKEQGFGGAFVHPRPGLITDYLSEDWFALYAYSLEVAERLGLDIWIYDENSYPSGFAGGHVPAQMPESYNQGQGLRLEKMNLLPENVKEYFLCLKREGDTFIDITSSSDRYKEMEGDFYLYKKTYHGRSKWHGGYSYVDLLYPGVTRKFIDVTMSGYEKQFGKKLGTAIKGIFTDEPHVASPGGTRWTPDLFDLFREQWGYDLKTALPLLDETEANYKQVRHNYMRTLTQLFIDRWSKPWFAYTEKKNMRWTGHYWEHGWPDLSHGGDNMAMYAWHQRPAIDMLFNQFNDSNPQAQFGNVRAVKELSSVANQMGYTRTLSETYGGGGWDVTFEDLKRLGDWEYALGVNFMNQHLSHMTIVGARKYDYPPVFTSLSPWWSNYKWLNDYFARLSLLLSQGEQVNSTLILEPTTTLWLYYSYSTGHPRVMEIGSNFQHFITKLEKGQVEYDLGSENIIKDQGSVKHGSFIVGKRAYSQVVIPPMTENLNRETFKLLKEFVNTGGELIAFSKPTFLDGQESAELARFFADNPSLLKSYSDALFGEVIDALSRNGKLRFLNVGSDDLYHHRRSYDDGELLFLVNSSLSDTATGTLSIVGESLMEIEGTSGDLYDYPCERKGEFLEAGFSLPPAGSLILFSSSTSRDRFLTKAGMAKGRKGLVKSRNIHTHDESAGMPQEVRMEAAGPLNIKRLQPNVLNIDFCSVAIDDTFLTNSYGDKNLYTVEAANGLYRHFGIDNPWSSAIQYRQTIVESDTFKTGDVKVTYHFTVAGEIDQKGIRLVAEQPDIWGVKINNVPVSPLPDESWLDARFGVYEIGEYLKMGVNVVELSVKPMSIYAEIAPVYLLGDFALESAPHGWVLREPVTTLRLGSWKEQGQPYYSWDVAYSKDYVIEDSSAYHTLQLTKWKGTLVEVWVNDAKVGIIACKPYRFDLSPHVREGSNKIEVRVIGSLKNLLGPHYNLSQGIAGPGYWDGVHLHKAGSDYNLIDYGLIEDFTVISSYP